jgi:hypothetical protein
MTLMTKKRGAVLVLWICSLGAIAQVTTQSQKAATAKPRPRKSINLKPASLSGYVFAITEGGDIKPARIADVYLFYSHPPAGSSLQAGGTSPETVYAADIFKDVLSNSDAQAQLRLKSSPGAPESVRCPFFLGSYVHAVAKTLDWADTKQSQVVFGTTDEEGKFTVSLPPADLTDVTFEDGLPRGNSVFAPGLYLVIVRGSAGFNDAVWQSEVTLRSGESLNIKLSEPARACLKNPR